MYALIIVEIIHANHKVMVRTDFKDFITNKT